MNIVNDIKCPACGCEVSPKTTLRACRREYIRVQVDDWIDGTTHSLPEPHLHARCGICGLEWLMPMADRAGFERVW
jgi:hypothetical protein